MINDIISPEFSEFLKLLFTWFEIIAVILYEYKAIKNLRMCYRFDCHHYERTLK